MPRFCIQRALARSKRRGTSPHGIETMGKKERGRRARPASSTAQIYRDPKYSSPNLSSEPFVRCSSPATAASPLAPLPGDPSRPPSPSACGRETLNLCSLVPLISLLSHLFTLKISRRGGCMQRQAAVRYAGPHATQSPGLPQICYINSEISCCARFLLIRAAIILTKLICAIMLIRAAICQISTLITCQSNQENFQ